MDAELVHDTEGLADDWPALDSPTPTLWFLKRVPLTHPVVTVSTSIHVRKRPNSA